jgi:hypothetical protein
MIARTSASQVFDDTLDTLLNPAAPIDTATVGAGVFGGASTALYLLEAGDSNAISKNDIHQGQIGDCYLLSPIGDLAATHPTLISNMIHVNTDGTETVTLYVAANGTAAKPGAVAFKAVTENVTNLFPTYSVNNGSSQDVVNGVKEIWAQVLEKAAADAGGGYGSIANGGNPAMAMEELTGHTANYYSPAAMTAAALQGFGAAGDLITFDTKSNSGLAYNLVSGHAYMFNGVVQTASGAAVSLSNPWGFNQPSLVPVSALSSVFAEVDVGRVS